MNKFPFSFLFFLFFVNGFSQNIALNFDGTTDGQRVKTTNMIPFSSSFTVMGWVNVSGGHSQIFSWGSPSVNKYLQIKSSFDNKFEVYSPLGVLSIKSTTVIFGTWHHVAVTNDNGSFKIYIDGVLEASDTANLSSINPTESSFGSALLNNIVQGKLKGNIEELSIWNIALLNDQINNYKDSPPEGSETGLVAAYDFSPAGVIPGGDNTGLTTLTDLTGNYPATLTNFSLNSSSGNYITSSRILKQDPNITSFESLNKTFGDSVFNLTGTSSSLSAITYTVSDESVATVSGSTVNIVGAGTTSITLFQIANSNYNAATATITLTVNKANPFISFSDINKTYGDEPFILSATSSNTNSFTYTISNTDIASVSGNTVTILREGTTLINLAQVEDSNYNGINVSATLIVNSADSDGDGELDTSDNCPLTANADQADADGDGIGDVCDNAPNTSNADQRDTDGDGEGDVIDTDDDGDGVPDTSDDFPLDSTESSDTDGDGTGDNADTDDDGDGILDSLDNCPFTANADQLDTDGDGQGDVCDLDDDNDGFSDSDEITCGSDPLLDSSMPLDTDSDGSADCIDLDDDNDGFSDEDEIICGTDPLLSSSKPIDTDSDGVANCIDDDDDNDGVIDLDDAFPLDDSETTDTDGDGIGNNSDTDDDGDGQLDVDEITCGSDPLDNNSVSLDTDTDGIPDCVDPDDDGDGVIDTQDAFPLDPAEWTDTDSDGIGNNADTDDDNDGYSDLDELSCESDPLDRFSKPSDIDNDGIPDCIDTDRDGDGVLNTEDAFPDDDRESVDTDGDGIGDNFEVDDDNDGILDTDDAFPLDPNEFKDSDGDGIGDNADPDDNNDGFTDEKIFTSGLLTPNSGDLESTWKIINLEKYPNARVKVYNRNGQEVFNKVNYRNDWRGTYKNSSNPLPAGSYYYMVDLNDATQEVIKGWLYITY